MISGNPTTTDELSDEAFSIKYGVSLVELRRAEEGHPDFQIFLAASLLVRNNEPDRGLHAAKWLIVAQLIREKDGKDSKITPILDFVSGALKDDQRELAWQQATSWVLKKIEQYERNPEVVIWRELREKIKGFQADQ